MRFEPPPTIDELRAIACVHPFWVAEVNGVLIYLDEHCPLDMHPRGADGKPDATKPLVPALAWRWKDSQGRTVFGVRPERWSMFVDTVHAHGGDVRYRKVATS